MNWHETVLTDKQVDTLAEKAFEQDGLLQHYVESRGHWERLVPTITEAQAEVTGDIAFKAGYEKGLSERTFNQWGQETTDLEVRREAMMKVVEWVEAHLSIKGIGHWRQLDNEQWQAQLKEWGIEETP